MCYDAAKGRSSLCILDAAAVNDGPLCRLWLNEAVPHGLHGCFSPEVYGLD